MTEQRVDALKKDYIIDRYRIERVLGEGGFGITYLAYHTSMGDPVAIKEYLPLEFAVREGGSTVLPRGGKAADTYAWGLKRFLDEAKTLARFRDHPNIVSVRDFFEANGTAYMVMQYEEGQTFGEWLAANPRPTQQQLLDIFIPVLDGLREVHAQQFLHRDIKPGNIYIRSDGRPLLIDFGASRLALGEHSRSLTNIITPGYSPKEQYTSTGNQGAWTDLYAIGATLWRAVSGKEPPLASDRGEARDEDRPDPLVPAVHIGRDRYAESFLRALDWAVAYLPKDRPQTVQAFQAVLLETWNRERETEVKTATPPPIQPTSTPPQPSSPAATIHPPQAQNASVGKWLVLASGVVALAGGGYWFGQTNHAGSTDNAVISSQPLPPATAKAETPATPANEAPVVTPTPPLLAPPSRLPFEPEMVDIAAGTFTMGCVAGRDDVEGGCDDDEKPAHEVSLSAYRIGKYEVTFEQWDACEQANACPHAEDEGWGRGNHPVINVSWDDITGKYLPWLNRETGQQYRLPTEAEWEHAARGGAETAYPWGNSISCDKADYNYDDCNTVGTSPVGSYAANTYGLYDTVGNVWEWVQDTKRGYSSESVRNPQGSPASSSSSAYRVLRGGSWFNTPWFVRSAYRLNLTPGARNFSIGFRLASGQ
ncbi:MAG: SUMF1/EgtB/PvdO family nonheme iron enzyme [Gammaproteobacteria bacterium]|nr:SUMF1/EgtB/PvdO family nonheme iron enzyme [Gammaproteobacteria bacterium]MBU2005646.1 SUMF1/EgtB/PvdO family nonheme iron enzyme [Gammaproteobacteria bacterium]